MKSMMIGAKKQAVWSVRCSLRHSCFELPASPWFSFANSGRNGNPICSCSDVSQIQLDSSSISELTAMSHDFSYQCCISIVVSPPCGSTSWIAYCGSALVTTMPSSLLPLVFVCLLHSWNLLLLRLAFSEPNWDCLHFTRVIYYQQILFLHIDLHSTPAVDSCTTFSSFYMPSVRPSGVLTKIEISFIWWVKKITF